MAIGDKLFVADKSTLDSVKNVVDIINSKPIKNLSDYTPVRTTGTISAGGAGFKTVLAVTGRGLLSKAVSIINDASDHQIKITIDGVVVVATSTKNKANYVTGFLIQEDILFGGTSLRTMCGTSSYMMDDVYNNYPSTQPLSTTSAHTVVLNYEIPFNSLVVEVTNSTGAVYDIQYRLVN